MDDTRTPSDAPRRVDFGRVSVFLGEKNGKYPDANMIVVRGSDTSAALDAPLVANRVGADFDTADLVVMTHAHEDHMAGLHRVPQARVFVHEADLAAMRSWEGMAAAYGIEEARWPQMLSLLQGDFFYVPRPDAAGFADGAVWELGEARIRAVHMPGHTVGHCALVIEPEGVAFIGDIDLSGFGPYYGDASSSLADFRRTLAMLPDIPAKVWVTGHHRGIYTERERFMSDLAAYAARIDARTERLAARLREAPRTLAELVDHRLLYPRGTEPLWVINAETRTIAQHLDEMVADGRVRVDGDGVYRPA